jgi:hypothetical protein
VLGGRRVERAHEDRAVAARRGEVEHAGDLGVQLARGHRLGRRGRQPAQVGEREVAQRGAVALALGGDQRHQPVADGRDRVLPRLD